MDLFDGFVHNYKTKLIILRIKNLHIVQEVCQSQESSIVIEFNSLLASLEGNQLWKREFSVGVIEILKLSHILKLRVIES